MIRRGAADGLSDLGRSPLLDGAEPRSGFVSEFLKFLGSGVVGLVGGVIAAFVAMILIAFAVFFTIMAMGGDPAEMGKILETVQSSEEPQTLGLAIGMLGFLAVFNTIFMVTMVLLASLLRRHPFRANITSAPRFRWGHLFAGLLAYGLALGGLLAVEAQFVDEPLKWPVLALTDTAGEIAILVVCVVAGFILAAFAEEILFRGWLLRETSVFTRNIWLLFLINGVLFSAIHINPMTMELDPNAFAARAAMGVAFCYMALRFGGIEFATGAHAANNILLTLVVQPLTFAEPPAEPMQTGLMIESVALLALAVAVTEIAVRLMRRRDPLAG